MATSFLGVTSSRHPLPVRLWTTMDEMTPPPEVRKFADVFGERPKILWVASSGGHVAQAHRIERLLGVNAESMWVTFDVPQTRSLLQGRRVSHVGYVAPRDMRAAWAAARDIGAIARREHFDFIISTGAAIALFGLPVRALVGRTPVVYVESLARSQGPSLTGKIMRIAPRVQTYTQYPSWERGAWSYTGTILDSFDARKNGQGTVRKIFVTLGTIRPYRFDRLVDAVLKIVEPSDQVTWQLGSHGAIGPSGSRAHRVARFRDEPPDGRGRRHHHPFGRWGRSSLRWSSVSRQWWPCAAVCSTSMLTTISSTLRTLSRSATWHVSSTSRLHVVRFWKSRQRRQ